MTKAEVKKRIEKLRAEINHHRYLYHVLDKSEISDAAHDSLKHELARLEEQYPDLITPDSPTQRVGGEPLKEFVKVKHETPMLSLNDAFSEAELIRWEARIKKLLTLNTKLDYYAEIKMDGLAIALIYDNGILAKGLTRGDGRTGEDVTHNIKTIDAIPLRLSLEKMPDKYNLPGRVEIRGEVYMSKKVLADLNNSQKSKGETEFANPRNAAAGSVRQLDPKIAAQRQLDFFAYDLVTDIGQTTHQESHELIQILGFKSNGLNQYCRDIHEVQKYYKKIENQREKLAYQMDGIVVNVNDIKTFKRLGVAGKAPRAALAYKYPAEQATTIVEDIKVQVGRTGALTPVAYLKPVKVAGSTIARATLHNEDEINRLDVRIGDTVIIQKAGDVIPDIVKVLIKLRTGRERHFKFPNHCPVCQSIVIRQKGEAAYYCTNSRCPAQIREKLYHFAAKAAFNIDGLGPRIIDQLLEKRLIRDPADLLKLKKKDVEPLEGFAERAAENLIRAIANSREISLSRFIYALGIRHVGEETAIDLADYFGSLDKIETASIEDLSLVHDVGLVVAKSIHEYFHKSENIKLLKKLFEQGVMIEKLTEHQRRLAGQTFVLTGALDGLTRDEAKAMIRAAGGQVSNNVSAKTDYLLAGTAAGSKLEKAKKLGVKVITQPEFTKLVK